MFLNSEELSKKFELTNHYFWRYLQIRDFASKKFVDFPTLPAPSCLDSLLKMNAQNKKRISYIFIAPLCCTQSMTVGKLYLGGSTIWQRIGYGCLQSSSMCSRHALTQVKLPPSLHFLKVKLAKNICQHRANMRQM